MPCIQVTRKLWKFLHTRRGVVIPHTDTTDPMGSDGDVEVPDTPQVDASPPHEPAMVPHEPAMVPHEPAMVPHEPAMVPHEPAMVPHEPAMVPQELAMVPHEPAMVTAAPLHLLTLPREIRNMIYDFLFRWIDLRTINEIGGVATVVAITNAPCVEVLLTSSRLHDEYIESECFRNLAAVIQRAEPWKDLIKWPSTALPRDKYKDTSALARVKSVDLSFAYFEPTVQNPIEMVDVLLARGITLHTVRLAEDALVAKGDMWETSDKKRTYTNLLSGIKVPHNTVVPQEIHGLPLRQSGRGSYRTIYECPHGGITYHQFIVHTNVFSMSASSANFPAKFASKEVYRNYIMREHQWAWSQVMASYTTASAASTAARKKWPTEWEFEFISKTQLDEWFKRG